MRLDDFRRCYWYEFEAICKAWQEMHEGDSRADWERTRILASISVSPHLSRQIPPKKLLPFPWDRATPSEKGDGDGEPEELTMEERRRRAEEFRRRMEAQK